jgi:glycosidase
MRTSAIALLCVLGTGCFDVDAAATAPTPQSLVEDWRDEIIYQVVTDRFADGDLANDLEVDQSGLALARYQGGDLRGIRQHLDYISALGVTAIWISPVFRTLDQDAGIAGYHGYWPRDFAHVNAHFGDLRELRELVAACHARGIKVILDIVVNHIAPLFYYDINENGQPDDTVIGTGAGGPLGSPGGAPVGHVSEFDPDYDPRGIQAATALGSAGPAPIRWFYDPAIDRVPIEPAVFQRPDFYHRRGRITDYTDRQQVLYGDFPGGLKDLDTENPDVIDALVGVYTVWIDACDFDGFRIDTVKHVDHPFWRAFAAAIRAHNQARGKRNFLLFGEVFDGDDALGGSYTQPGELDSVQYFAHKYRVIDAVFKQGAATREIQRLYAERALHYGGTAAPDGIGTAPRDSLVTFVDNHDVPRFLFDLPDPPALRQALGYLLTSDGIPALYYGTEQEFAGGSDPANRERLWSTGFPTDGETFRWIRGLTDLRRAYPSLARGDLTIRWATDRNGSEEDAGAYAFERSLEAERLLVALNVSAHPAHTAFGSEHMQTGFPGGTALHALFPPDSAQQVTVEPDGRVVVQLAPRELVVLSP